MEVQVGTGITSIEIKIVDHKTGKTKKMKADISPEQIKDGIAKIKENEWVEVE